jgi:hypothetical protein
LKDQKEIVKKKEEIGKQKNGKICGKRGEKAKRAHSE